MKKAIIFGLVAIAVAGAGYWYTSNGGTEGGSVYRFVTTERGDLESVVSATGSLGAVTTVQVGTQVSGIVQKIFVDFNDKVRRGQMIALIDSTLLVSSVRDAEANLARNHAQHEQALREYQRINDLYSQQFVSEADFNLAKYNLDVAEAGTRSAEISLERAKQNLSYARIYSPISGTIIERNVDVGQTVAASLSAPQLFLIANDLSEMQILASVDESDIGSIKEGQITRFTVQAYPDDSFEGTVRQVRLQSTMQENVVAYTVVVNVDNKDGRLLPGMTATVEFLVDRAENVIKIPNAALRFRPTEAMMASFRQQMEQRAASMPDSVRNRFAARRGSDSDATEGGQAGQRSRARGASDGESSSSGIGGPGGGFGGFGSSSRNSDQVTLWYLDEDGNLTATRARTGISDGQMTEIMGRNVEEGMQIIAGVTLQADESTVNPFQSQQSSGRRPGGF